MAEREDPLDELRAAWRALRAPDPAPATSEGEEDAAERAAVEWMRAAWSALEAPAVATPRRLMRARFARRVLAPFAAAAGIFALALVASRARRNGVEQPPGELAPIVEHTGIDVPSTALAALDRAEGGVELHHGSVRLILLEPEPPAAEGGDAR